MLPIIRTSVYLLGVFLKRLILFLGVMAVSVLAAQTTYRFTHREGEKIRFLGLVNQRVWTLNTLDRRASLLQAALNPQLPWRLVQTVEMLNRIQQETLRVDSQGRGYIRGGFQVTQQKIIEGGGQPIFLLAEEYTSEFWRDPQGRYEIGPTMVMPVVRHVPTFPEAPSEEWTANGEEYHDLSADFGILTPLRVRFVVNYKKMGRATFEGKEFDVFRSEYSFETPVSVAAPGRGDRLVPTHFAGKTVQRIYWDNVKGRQVYYEEDYVLALRLSNGSVYRFEGDANAKMIEAPPMDREQEAERIREQLRESGQPNVDVVPTERGVTIQLPENFIRFPADSSELLPSERQKLNQIAEILRRYPDRDLLIEGHTALAGTEEGRQRLSEERARSVGSYLIQQGVRTPDRLTFRGWGANRPVAPNDTEANRARNRRVEITILEN